MDLIFSSTILKNCCNKASYNMPIISILSIFLLICSKCQADELLHVSFDEVGALNYTYYGLVFKGPIRLYLYTISGDADLYVSQHLTKPTFEIESHCLESTTCGLDVIDVPRSFKRPVGIGVYGHPSHAKSVYRLEAYYRESGIEDEFFFSTPEQVENERGNIKRDNEFYKKADLGEYSQIWPYILYFCDFILEIMLL